MTGRAPETREVIVALTPEQAYTRALAALTQLGADVTAMERPALLVGRVHRVVVLAVHLQPVEQGTRYTVTGSVEPGHLTLGHFDELTTYMALLTQEP
jgi:hypothetical protein